MPPTHCNRCRIQAAVGNVLTALVPKARIVKAVRPEDMNPGEPQACLHNFHLHKTCLYTHQTIQHKGVRLGLVQSTAPAAGKASPSKSTAQQVPGGSEHCSVCTGIGFTI